MIQESGNSRAVVLPIDEGERWWSTRLLILASLLQSLTAVRQIVFCDSAGRFIGMASPSAIWTDWPPFFHRWRNLSAAMEH
jgi:hypothetical protein